MQRYSRQIPLIGEEGQQRLAAARVLIVGVGGLGSPIALYLAAAGVGTLGLVDDDVVSISNLQRQVLYAEAEVGMSKVHCAARRLQALNSALCVNVHPMRLTADNAREIISDYDIIVDGCDNFATRYLLSDVCKELGRPYVYGAISATDGQVAVLCHTTRTYRDLFPDEEAMKQMPPLGNSVLGTTPAIVGSVQANEVIKLITGIGEPLSAKLWTIDLQTMESQIISI